jgi:bacterioferritin
MTNQTRSLENLQQALAMEMTAIHQYLLHAHVLSDWGLDVLAEKMREEKTEELGHAGRFIDRILFLGGSPEIKATKTPKLAEALEDLFAADLEEEKGAIDFYAKAAQAADEDRDVGTRVLFENILLDEEGHKDWLAQQLNLLKRMGEPTYMVQNMSDVAKSA